MKKRGQSQIIVIVLIILLIIVLIGILWNVVKTVVESSEEQIDISGFIIDLEIQSAHIRPDNESMVISVKRNRGKGEIDGLRFILTDSEGVTYFYDYTIEEGLLNELESKTYEVNSSWISELSDFSDIVSVGVAFIVGGKVSNIQSSLSNLRNPGDDKLPTTPPDEKDKDEINPIAETFDLTDNVLILYNKNAGEALDIAQYYADVRGIDSKQICGVQLPTGQFATADQMFGARKTIINDCLCNLDVMSDISDCSDSKINEIAEISPITHMAIIKGIPPRLTGVVSRWTGYFATQGKEEPSFDFHFANSIYRDYNIFTERPPGDVYLTGDNIYPFFYKGFMINSFDFQNKDSTKSYIREIKPELDGAMVYGRIEAIDTQRTKDLIDRTINAEQKGVEGNFLIGLSNNSYAGASGFKNENPIHEFLNLFTSTPDSCGDYLFEGGNWDYNNCKVGITAGEIPGEIGSIIPIALNAGVYFGNHYGPSSSSGIYVNHHNAFDGFENMLNWHKSEIDCIELCEDCDGVECVESECKENSQDYFKEINTDCVGVADGFMGWQYRSWPVQYYGFWPNGWGQWSGGNGATERTPPVILNENGNNYLHYGALDSVENPQCVLEDESNEECLEIIGIDLRQYIYFSPYLTVPTDFKFSMKYRTGIDDNGRVLVRPLIYYSDGTSDSSSYNYFYFENGNGEWQNEELVIAIDPQGKSLNKILLDIKSSLGDDVQSWMDIDEVVFEIKDSGNNLLDVDAANFDRDQKVTMAGDWASNVIDRLGGIAWWGSSSHWLPGGGHVYSWPDGFAGAFYSGKSLGESLFYSGKEGGASGIIYGDPLYRPSGVKIFNKNNSLVNELNSEDRGLIFFENNLNENIFINAFHGQGSLEDTNWDLFICYNKNNITDCGVSDWEKIKEGDNAVFEYPAISLIELMDDLDLDKNQDFFMKLRAWNPGEEENDLTNYAYFHYNVDSDNDGLPDYLENRIFNGLEYDDKDDFDNDGFWNIEEFSENTLLNFNENYPFCFLERHCPLSKPFCYDYQCKMCIDDFDCFSIDKPYCFDGVCHECTEETEDIDCAKYEDKSRCPSYLCVECNEETEVLDCGGGQCVGHTCFECTEETEATDCAGGVCLGNVCVECNSHDQCGVNEYCWLDNTCQTKSCTDVSQCEDYDDCSEDECVEGFCKFTKFTDEKYCYYCAGLDYCSQKGGMNICGGTDLDHSGFVEYSDVSIFSNLCVLDIPCDENNNFCDYADINRDGYPYCGEVNKIVEYYNLECRTL